MKYYAEIINGIVANLGTFDTPTLPTQEGKTIYEITLAQAMGVIAGKTTEAEMALIV